MRPSGAPAVHARPLAPFQSSANGACSSVGAKLFPSRERKTEGGGRWLERGLASGGFLLPLLLFGGAEWGYSSKERRSLSMTTGGGGAGRPC